MKEPKCSICGGRHYKFQCWQKPKPQMKQSYIRPSESRSKAVPFAKTHTKSSQGQSQRQSLVKRLDTVVSRVLRKKYANKNGIATCYTCGIQQNWKLMDCGHFIKRRFTNTRWDFDNLRPQCQHCNRDLHGNYTVYRTKMKQQLGQDGVQRLLDKAQSSNKIPTPAIEEMLKQMILTEKTLDLK